MSSKRNFITRIESNVLGMASLRNAGIVLVLFVFIRLAFGAMNFSHFAVAGSDFCDNSYYPSLKINEGQGYDGQFFYRFANNPFDISKEKYGITVDHPSYRAQRIVYPLSAWLLSFGGIKTLVPFALVLINLLGFLGIIFMFKRFSISTENREVFMLLPFLLIGLWMSLARDLAEVLELLFFLMAVYASFKNKTVLFSISVLLALFTRDTSFIALGAYSALYFLSRVKSDRQKAASAFVIIAIPFVLLMFWKGYLNGLVAGETVDGSQNISWPFHGIIYGMKQNFNFNGFRNILESSFWFAYFIWQILFTALVLRKINFRQIFNLSHQSNLAMVFTVWMLFAICLGPAIYVDDWGFVRILTLWNGLGLLLVLQAKSILNIQFVRYSYLLLAASLLRFAVIV